jgi:DNA-binding XRE family transcriptional regulator
MVQNTQQWRLFLGWSQWQLAKATGIDRTRLSLIENQHVVPNSEEQATIRRALLEETARMKAILAGVEELVSV